MKRTDTKKRIMEEALRLFSENGYDAVSVEQIAQAVGIKAPSLYNHYKSKRAIFDGIVMESSRRYAEFVAHHFVHLEHGQDDLAAFRNISEDMLAARVREIFLYPLHDETVSRFRRMMTLEQFRSPELAALYTERYVERLVDYHAALFRQLIRIGQLKPEDPDTLALTYISPMIAMTGVCDRQPEREAECLERLDAHVRLFYRNFTLPCAAKK